MKATKQYGEDIDLALGLWVKLARAFTSFRKHAMKDIAGFGVTQSQFAVIECLGHLGSLTLGELSKKLLVSGGNTTVVVDNLERGGLVERIHDTHDRRIVSVQLTQKGSDLFSNIFLKHARYVLTLASVLSKEEQVQLSALLSKLGHGLMELK